MSLTIDVVFQVEMASYVGKVCSAPLESPHVEVLINGTTIFIWAAVDLDDEKVIATWVSFGPRSAIEQLFGYIEWRIRRCLKLMVSYRPLGKLK